MSRYIFLKPKTPILGTCSSTTLARDAINHIACASSFQRENFISSAAKCSAAVLMNDGCRTIQRWLRQTLQWCQSTGIFLLLLTTKNKDKGLRSMDTHGEVTRLAQMSPLLQKFAKKKQNQNIYMPLTLLCIPIWVRQICVN